ncbi:glutaredoxin [Halapricum sp. CBA1109]|uniref:glutaredoxin family protein n=1 Tax=Halapricum sp. CBA1109 TaxID=2668068 RepID=UPI0012F89AE8|nr:glutaredoxin domain-containing protein [Halapricum sp. CBA1109]MUV90727.1 glutaredoxin [Halapricum sp. CBA1109]
MAFDQSQNVAPEDVPERVETLLDSEDRVLFIKGTPQQPQCGFSQRAVGTLARRDVEFECVNVLPALAAYREALESHSGWETIPQLYVDGEFVGGSDIIVELEERDELASALDA